MNRHAAASEPGPTLVEPLARAVDAARRRIAQLNDLTQESVLGIGRSLGELVEIARGYARQARATLEDVGRAGGRDGVAGAIGRQNAILSKYADQIRRQVEKQNRVADRAVETSFRIAEVGSQISSMATQTRLLSRNARVEAERIGGAGEAFGAIAAEMTTLSRQVEQTNRSVDEVVASLSQALPEVVQAAREMRESSDFFVSEISTSIAQVNEQVHAMRRSARNTLVQGDECVATILSLSQAALSCLQFQDPVAQGLQALTKDLSAAMAQCEQLLVDSAVSGEWRSAAARLVPEDERAIRHVSAVAPHEEAADPGELVLF